MDTQTLLNLLFGVIITGVSWWSRVVWSELKRLEQGSSEHKVFLLENYLKKEEVNAMHSEILKRLDRVGNIELLLANQYVTKVDISDILSTLNARLERIESKLDNKADK